MIATLNKESYDELPILYIYIFSLLFDITSVPFSDFVSFYPVFLYEILILFKIIFVESMFQRPF